MKNKKLLNTFSSTFLSASIVAASLVGGSHLAEASTTTASSTKFNMSYLFFGDYSSEVTATKGSLNAVSPDYLELTSDGNLKVTSKYSKAFVDEMHKEGLKVTPYLSNNWNRTTARAGLLNRQTLAQEIADQINSLNLDGVDIDIENLTEADEANFTDFIKILKSKLPDKDVSIAVAANPYGSTAGFQGMYDYKSLSENSDYLMIMAYDESWDGDQTPGPVAGLPWVEQSVQYAINQGVSPDKVVLGIPFYGRLWKIDGPTTNGSNVYGTAVSQKNVDNLVKKYNGTVVYDAAQHSEKATFTIGPTDPTSVAGGITLTAGNYVLWYDDQKTITEKIGLVNKYNLKGTGSWSLNQEDPSTWDYFRNVLDGNSSVIPEQTTEQTPTSNSNQTIYKVVSGDYLSTIAKKYSVTVQAIKEANGLSSDLILVGQSLIIPVKTTPTVPTPTVPTPTVSKSLPTVSKPSPSKPVTKGVASTSKPVTKTISVTKTSSYKVARGDSLSKIAKKYHTSVTQIKKDNRLRTDTIRIGQVLKVKTTTTQKVTVTPSQSAQKAVPLKVTAQSVKESPAKPVTKSVTPTSKHVTKMMTVTKTSSYKVVRGDCLSKIAKKYHSSVAAIKKVNRLKSDAIRIGQVLTIKK